jgi:hypothetical protein
MPNMAVGVDLEGLDLENSDLAGGRVSAAIGALDNNRSEEKDFL